MKDCIYYSYTLVHGKLKKVRFNMLEALFFLDNYEKILIFKNLFSSSCRDESFFLSEMIKNIQPSDTVYDIGAAYGLYSIILAKYLKEDGSVYAVEPVESNYRQLQKNIKINQLKNIIPIKIALGDHAEIKYIGKAGRGGIGTYSFIEGDQAPAKEKVEIVRGDWLSSHLNIPRPKAVKIDVEGFEYPVLLGLEKTLASGECKLVCCEIHSRLYPEGIHQQDIIELLGKYGFHSVRSRRRGTEVHAVFEKMPLTEA
jgi:FkbM family methyltransferase